MLLKTPAPQRSLPLTNRPATRRLNPNLLYTQLRNTTRRLVHPFVMALGWPSAATIYHRRRLLEAAIIGVFLTTLMFTAIMLCIWFTPPPPLVVSLGADEVSVVQLSPTAAPPTSTPLRPTPTPQPAFSNYAASTPYDPQIYLPLFLKCGKRGRG